LLAAYGQMLTFAGQSEKAKGWVVDAMRRNPHYPGWYASALSTIQYLQKDYKGAIATLTKVGKLAVWDRHYLAASYAQLGRDSDAQSQVDAIVKADPKFSLAKLMPKLHFRLEADKSHFLDGLKKVGFPE
jgi:tetratricopeptide (TPR) repeat protein